MFFSIIIPLYNRPQEIEELLSSLSNQEYDSFEVIVIEDGSSIDSRNIIDNYKEKLNLYYYYKENGGQGFARNYGFEKANGDYFIIFDSDCLIPTNYLNIVQKNIVQRSLDAFGGPDSAHQSFTMLQKAINYSMTSPFTTGGIRGRKQHIGTFHPRSFNMGLSRNVWETIGGFKLTRLGEDIEYSIRIINAGFNVGLISEAFVYHKRRTNLLQFYKQLHFFGRARINIYQHYPSQLKLVHFFPLLFFFFLSLTFVFNIFQLGIAVMFNTMILLYIFVLFVHALWTTRSFSIAFLSILTSLTQLVAYGLGFLEEFGKMILRNDKK